MKISRKKLIKVAFKTLAEFPEVTDDQRGHLLYMACTIKRVALHAWVVDQDCGCLVGSYYMRTKPEALAKEECAIIVMDNQLRASVRRRAITALADDDGLRELGERFDEILSEALGIEDPAFNPSQAVEVTD